MYEKEENREQEAGESMRIEEVVAEEFDHYFSDWLESPYQTSPILRMDLMPDAQARPIYNGEEIDYEIFSRLIHDVILRRRTNESPKTRNSQELNPKFTTPNIDRYKKKHPKGEVSLSLTSYQIVSDDNDYNNYLVRYRYYDPKDGIALGEIWVGRSTPGDREPEFLKDYDREINKES